MREALSGFSFKAHRKKKERRSSSFFFDRHALSVERKVIEIEKRVSSCFSGRTRLRVTNDALEFLKARGVS